MCLTANPWNVMLCVKNSRKRYSGISLTVMLQSYTVRTRSFIGKFMGKKRLCQVEEKISHLASMTSSNLLWYLLPKTCYKETINELRQTPQQKSALFWDNVNSFTWIFSVVLGSRNVFTVFHNSLNPEPALIIYIRHRVYKENDCLF